MTVEQNDLTIRPITGREELDLFSRLPYVLNEELADDLAAGRRRPRWMWVALRGDRLLARAAWWGQSGDDTPVLLDVFDIDDSSTDRERVDIGLTLVLDGTLDAHSRDDLARMPAHRGNGYIDEILAEGTRILSAEDVPRIRAATDLGNTPMANAFQRAGYVNFERVINMTWD
ncbi:hypothetical protein JOL79_12510 [Microbispora sp. RL4-1S]|uniref:GNAT family N-acetyltransferase n=1 Tax=Microbispora oryzae TaxID=2806554 RepID=A0A941AHZ8_9ACTN|nr:hypothetical protein [Microbispora oryzae]MBP2704636.1 hypothetical protein [Microbispora oryzae]